MLIVLRFLHIVAGVLWVGGVVFVAAFLMPSLRAVGPTAGAVMAQIGQVRKYPIFAMVQATLVILSGIALIIEDSGAAPGSWMQSGAGRMFSTGGALAILGAVLGMTLSSPAARKMGAIAGGVAKRGGAPTAEEAAEMQRLQAKVAGSTRVVAALLILATIAMAIARYS